MLLLATIMIMESSQTRTFLPTSSLLYQSTEQGPSSSSSSSSKSPAAVAVSKRIPSRKKRRRPLPPSRREEEEQEVDTPRGASTLQPPGQKQPGTTATSSAAAAAKPSLSESRFDEQRRQYYRRLLHTCRKDVNKCAKHTKRLECQKRARLLKEATASSSPSELAASAAAAAAATSVEKLEAKYHAAKSLDLEKIVREVLRRLGIENLNPDPPSGDDSCPTARPEAGDGDTNPDVRASAASERVLQHKNMLECVERWNDQVTEYRRWCLRHHDAVITTATPKPSRSAAGRPHKKHRTAAGSIMSKKAAVDVVSSGIAKSVFVHLGGNGDDNAEYGAEPAEGGIAAATKKNRPGQRARQAKADALRAKEEGRERDRSLNWREPKASSATRASGERGPHHHRREGRRSDGAGMPGSATSDAAPEAKAHPSWQAAAQKTNKGAIVQFQGTKTTF